MIQEETIVEITLSELKRLIRAETALTIMLNTVDFGSIDRNTMRAVCRTLGFTLPEDK